MIVHYFPEFIISGLHIFSENIIYSEKTLKNKLELQQHTRIVFCKNSDFSEINLFRKNMH